MRTITTLDLQDAERALRAMKDHLLRVNKTAVLAVADAHGDLLALLRTDGAAASSVTIARNKAWTAAREGQRTYDIGQRIKSKDDSFDLAYYGDSQYCAWGGGVPVFVNGVVVGAVAVSGLPELEDQSIAELGVVAITQPVND